MTTAAQLVQTYWNNHDITPIFDEAVTRALALGRPFQREEIFQDFWDQGLEISPQWDRRFVLLQETDGTTPRVWGVRPDPTGLRESVDAYFANILQHRLLSQDITINGQSYHVVGRTPHELAQEVARMREEHTVSCPAENQPRGQESLPCSWCGTPVTVGVECGGKRYCDEECVKWDSALSCGIVPEEHTTTAGFNPDEPY